MLLLPSCIESKLVDLQLIKKNLSNHNKDSDCPTDNKNLVKKYLSSHPKKHLLSYSNQHYQSKLCITIKKTNFSSKFAHI